MANGEATKSDRLVGIDALRGAVIVLMALDHVRDFWTPTQFAPEDLSQSSVGWFLTRWVTHFCAPVFVFLAGVGAALWRDRGRDRVPDPGLCGQCGYSRSGLDAGAACPECGSPKTGESDSRKHPAGRGPKQLFGFLLSRGIWLILVEFVYVSFWWGFNQQGTILFAQVIWAIGASMVVLAFLQFLPRLVVGAVGALIVLGHNALDGLYPGSWTSGADAAETIAHVLRGGWHWIPISQQSGVFVVYALLPWLGVMALGYAVAPVARWSKSARTRACLIAGSAMIAAFLLLRWQNLYGEPNDWEQQKSWALTACSWLNCSKYPPSLLYILMTLGPAILLFPLIERLPTLPAKVLATFGRVPFFFYMIHLPVIILGAGAFAYARFGKQMFDWSISNPPPPEYNLGLWMTYVAWAGAVLLLYPACWAFARLKRRGWWWMGYF